MLRLFSYNFFSQLRKKLLAGILLSLVFNYLEFFRNGRQVTSPLDGNPFWEMDVTMYITPSSISLSFDNMWQLLYQVTVRSKRSGFQKFRHKSMLSTNYLLKCYMKFMFAHNFCWLTNVKMYHFLIYHRKCVRPKNFHTLTKYFFSAYKNTQFYTKNYANANYVLSILIKPF